MLTHGVGPVREYSIGALLLDRDDPTRISDACRAAADPADDDARRYVPNVVYSCGALVHDQTVLFRRLQRQQLRLALLDLPALEWLLERPVTPSLAGRAATAVRTICLYGIADAESSAVHLALPVHDIGAARRFYGEVLGSRAAVRPSGGPTGTSRSPGGHPSGRRRAGHGGCRDQPVDGHDVPVPHFGLVLSVERSTSLPSG